MILRMKSVNLEMCEESDVVGVKWCEDEHTVHASIQPIGVLHTDHHFF